MVYPVFDLEFLISATGKVPHDSNPLDGMIPIAEMETFEVSIDGNVVDWSPMEQKGWVRRLMTGKSFSISLSGKRQTGDAGNDYIAGLALKTGNDCSTTGAILFPDGALLLFDTVVDVGRPFGGQSKDVSVLEFDLLSDGKPTYTEGGSGALEYRTFELEQQGGTAGTTPSSGIKFTFSETVSGLLAEHIYITSGTGSAAKGALSGTGKNWTLNIVSPTQGSIYVVIKGHDSYRFTSVPTQVTVFSD